MTIKRQLLILVLAAVVPMFIFSGMLVGYVTFQQNHALEMSLQGNTRTLSAAVDEQITAIKSSLMILAIVEDFDDVILKDLHRRLRRFVKNQEDWSSVGLATTSGKQLFSTKVDYGKKLPSWDDQAFFKEVIKTGKPAISDFRVGKLAGDKVFSVGVPVRLKGTIKFVLVATVKTTLLSKMLTAQNFPGDWVSSIIDKDGLILARSADHEKISGLEAPAHLLEKIRNSKESIFKDTTRDGHKAYGSYSKFSNLGWTVVLAMPDSSGEAPSRNFFWYLLIGGLAFLSLGMALAILFSQRIAESIMALSVAARAVGRGDRPEMVLSNLSELNEVIRALDNACEERDKSDAISKELYEKAQQAIELRDNFLSVASHELKTPLTTINLQAQLIKRSLEKAEGIKDTKYQISLSRMLNQLRRLSHLIDDLLDISRINAGRLEINKEKIDLAEITREIASNFEEDYHSKGSTLKVTGPETLIGYFDQNRVEQVITNLISNAIKYGDGKPIEVTIEEKNKMAIIKVIDQGQGIRPENHAKIFERFERVNQNREVSGLGLGLWIVKRIVEQLNGTINVESEGLGLGSTFILELPTEKTVLEGEKK